MGLGVVSTQLTSAATAPFVLRIGGRIYTASSPVGDGGVASCTIRETSEGSPNQMSFAIEDPSGSIDFDTGEETELIDRRSGTDRSLFGGHLIELESTPRGSGYGRMLSCTAIGYDAWLDWRVIPSWTSKTNKNGRITKITHDRAMVQQLVNRYATFLEAPDSKVDSTNTTMEVVSVRKVTLREALQRVAETATADDTEATRYFYVDNDKRVHYHRGSENLTAPYRISDGSYTRTVLATSGLVSLWTLQETSGTPAYDGMAYAHATASGAVQRGVAGGIVNDEGMRAAYFGGTSGFVAASGANLHPGDTFSVEFWFKRGTTGTTQTVWSGGTGDVEVGFTSGNALVVYLEGTGNHFVSTDTYTSTSAWHHVVVARSPGSTAVYVDGASISGTTTARTFAAGSGTVNIGRRKSSTDRYYLGSLQHVAVYSSKLSAATALAHYEQGVSLTPQAWVYTRSAFDGREAVYVSGSNAAGTGWVRNPSLIRSAFGAPGRQPERQEIIDREDSEGAGKKRAYGRWFLKANNDPEKHGSFTVVGYDGWRAGQTVYLTNTADGLDGYAASIKQVDTDVLFGSGVLSYDITWGRRQWSGARAAARKDKRG